MSVMVPIVVPFTITLAPITGSPLVSLTTPEIFLLCCGLAALLCRTIGSAPAAFPYNTGHALNSAAANTKLCAFMQYKFNGLTLRLISFRKCDH